MAVALAPAAHAASAGGRQQLGQLLRLALVLGKARVVGLVTFTALVGTVAAAGGRPSLTSLLGILAIGLLAGGGAGALNHVMDRDLDRRMRRTCRRPLPTGQVAVGAVAALGAASVLAGLAVAWLLGPAVWLHTLVAAATYVLVYTRLLKRHTPHSVVIGGWTGAAAVLAGWEATGRPLTVTALALSAVVFLWTPAHFWGLAIARLEEYRRAGVPVLPLVVGVRRAAWAVALSAGLTVAVAATPLLAGQLGPVYAAGLVAASAMFGLPLYRLIQGPALERAWRAYKASGLFLLLLFVGALADSLARAG